MVRNSLPPYPSSEFPQILRATMCDLIDRVDAVLLAASEPHFAHCMYEEDDRACPNVATVVDIETGAEYCSFHFGR